MIITVTRGIPSDITVRLGKETVTFAVSDAILFAFFDEVVKCFWQKMGDLAKKWGILIKKESEGLDFTGLEIPRDYC